MIHLFVNALAASAGGGTTYVRNVVPHLGRRADTRATVAVPSALSRELRAVPNVDLVELPVPDGAALRFFFEQQQLPALLRERRIDVLISAGNFALWRSPVPQILLSRNALYTSKAFFKDLRARGDVALLVDTHIKRALAGASIRSADVTVAPSAAFAAELRKWLGPRTGQRIVSIHHGFDPETFHAAASPPSPELAGRLVRTDDALRLLFVSHYNYYRNFETLLRALPLVQSKLSPRSVELLLTCNLEAPQHSGSYRAGSVARLCDELKIRSSIVELGAIPYELLHHLYCACDIYVTPAYAESFAHPLVEAMSSGLPVIASDLAVHREICQDCAVYFPASSPHELATKIVEVAQNSAQSDALSAAGRARSKQFSWQHHVDELLALARRLLDSKSAKVL